MGKLIVIDGLDGSGKTTQEKSVFLELKKYYEKIKVITFPDYEHPSSVPVKLYLNGEISSNVNDINAYAASSFYAVDRYISYKKYWEKEYKDGYLIMATRYVTSNAIHQMVKLKKQFWNEYIDWLMDYEYNKLELPMPDKVIYLDMPRSIANKLILARYEGDISKKDIHEKNLNYLQDCYESAQFVANKLNWHTIACSENDRPLSQEKITKNILEVILNDKF